MANVFNDPADDTARLVLADWLDEHGEGDFGHFVRAGVCAAQFGGMDVIDDPDFYAALQTLTVITSEGAPARWLSALGVGPAPHDPSDSGAITTTQSRALCKASRHNVSSTLASRRGSVCPRAQIVEPAGNDRKAFSRSRRPPCQGGEKSSK
jgi:uncharacterized protein (TIGR02996 family)